MATQVTISGTMTDAEGTALSGTVTFRPTQAMYDTSANRVISTAPVIATLSGDGTFTLTVFATDDATTSPDNATYNVSENLTGADGNPIKREYRCEIPSASSSLRYEDITEAVPTTTATASYATTAQIASFNAHTSATTTVHGITDTSLLLDTSSVVGDLADVDSTAASNDQALLWDGDSWAPQAIAVGKISATGTPSSSTYLRGDGSWASVAITDHLGWGFPTTVAGAMWLNNRAMPANNQAHYVRSLGGGTISSVGLIIGTSSGNISIGTFTGAAGRSGPTARTQTSGAVACPASGYAEVALGGSVTIDSATGWLGLSADNSSATFSYNGSTGNLVTYAGFGAGMLHYEVGGHPLPASPSSTVTMFARWLLVGVA